MQEMAVTTPYSRTLETPRLILKLFDPAVPEHYTNQLALANSEIVRKRLGNVQLKTKEAFEDRCRRQRPAKEICTKLNERVDPPSHPYHLIYLRSDNGELGSYIGGISFFHRKETGLMPDIGWG